MNDNPFISAGRTAQLFACGLLILALYFAQDILIPIALAILISFLLYPLVKRQMRWKIPQPVAVGTSVLLAAILAVGLGYVVINQAYSLGEQLPNYRENLVAKVRALKGGSNTVQKVSDTIESVKNELATTQPSTQQSSMASVTHPEMQTVPVRVVDVDTDYFGTAASVAGPLLHPVATLGMVFLLTIFILLGADELRDRLIWLAGTRQISLTNSALDDVGTTIGRFLRTQLLVNAAYGVLTTLSMWMIGVPNAMLWGLLAALLRYVPFLGPWIALALPLMISIATSSSWSQPIYVLVSFIACEAIINGLVEPWCYSGSTGMTAWGVVLASFFWGWLWGPVGLILSVPLTTCLVVLGKYIPQFSFFTRFLGSGDILPAEGRLYQRLLVWDEAGADAIFKSELKAVDSTPESIADKLFVPILQTLKRDMQADIVNEEHAAFLQQTTDQIDQLGPFLSDDIVERPTILLVSGPARADEIASRILARLAISKGFTADIVKAAKLASEAVQRVKQSQPFVIGVVQSAPVSVAHATYLLKLLRKNEEDRRLLFIGLQPETISEPVIKHLTGAGVTKCFNRFSDVLGYLAAHEPVRQEELRQDDSEISTKKETVQL